MREASKGDGESADAESDQTRQFANFANPRRKAARLSVSNGTLPADGMGHGPRIHIPASGGLFYEGKPRDGSFGIMERIRFDLRARLR